MPVLIMMNKPYNDDEALETVVDYVLLPGSEYYSGYGVYMNYPVQQMRRVKELWGEDHGRRVRHFILPLSWSEPIGYAQRRYLPVLCRLSVGLRPSYRHRSPPSALRSEYWII